MKIGIIGAGVVGNTMAVKLFQLGYPIVMVASQTFTKAEALAAKVQAVPGSARQVVQSSDLVLITTPDRVIEPLVKQLAGECHPGQVLAHFSGALSVEIMASARVQGAVLLSLHPLQTFASVEIALAALPGTHFTIEGDDPLLGCRLVSELGGIPHPISSAGKAIYHAGACIASNYLVVLAHIAADLLKRSGFPAEEALPALLPLMRGTLNSLETKGLPDALTGPISRGDFEVVASHLQEIPSEYQVLYKLLGHTAAQIALAKQTIDEIALQKLAEVLR